MGAVYAMAILCVRDAGEIYNFAQLTVHNTAQNSSMIIFTLKSFRQSLARRCCL